MRIRTLIEHGEHLTISQSNKFWIVLRRQHIYTMMEMNSREATPWTPITKSSNKIQSNMESGMKKLYLYQSTYINMFSKYQVPNF